MIDDNKKQQNILKARSLLGMNPSFGSKSAYHYANPQGEPVFNATIMAQDKDGELYRVWYGDLELKDENTLGSLKSLAESFGTILYVYRESTVNNSVFNGGMFPYQQYELRVDFRGENRLSTRSN